MIVNNSNDPKLLRIKEAASLIGISDQTLRVWVKKGYIKCVTFPSGERRFKKEEIDRLIKEINDGGNNNESK